MFLHMRPPGFTLILLTVACAICAAAIAALPGPGAPRGNSADAAKIVSALSIVPQAVTSWEKTAKEKAAEQKAAKEKAARAKAAQEKAAKEKAAACARSATSPELGLEPATPAACPSPNPEKSTTESG
jgi:hypothetical protein